MLQAESGGLRERKKERTREAIIAAALDAFESEGFEETTVEQLAARAEVSRRTFFRYFESKEAVVFPHHEARLRGFRAALSEVSDADSPYARVRCALRRVGERYMERKGEAMVQHRIVESSSSLLGKELELDRDWEAALAEALTGAGCADERVVLQAQVLAGAMIGAIRVAMREWFAADGNTNLVSIGDQVLDQLEGGIPDVFLLRSSEVAYSGSQT